MLMWITAKKEEHMRTKFATFSLIILFVLIIISSGCTVVFQKGRRVDVEKISKLKGKVNDLEAAKSILEDRLKGEIDDKEVTIEMLERGLVITFVAEVLYDSGKAELRSDSLVKLDKVAYVLNTSVSDLNVGIEGHTDNEPIKHSGWKTNWELSTSRALSVLHYLVERGLNPKRLAASGYGEYRPIASNNSAKGRQKNRRVEIIIIPPTIDAKKAK